MTKRQLPGNCLVLARVGCFRAIPVVSMAELPQETRPKVAKANKLERRKAVPHERATDDGHQDEQYKTVRSSNVNVDQNLTRTVGRNAEAPALYVIKASPGKGLGMFATEDIQKGTRILAENPFFTLTERPVVSSSDPYAPNDISQAFDRLSDNKIRKFMSLHCPKRHLPGRSQDQSLLRTKCPLLVERQHRTGNGTCCEGHSQGRGDHHQLLLRISHPRRTETRARAVPFHLPLSSLPNRHRFWYS